MAPAFALRRPGSSVDVGGQQSPARPDPVVRYRTDNSFAIVYKDESQNSISGAQREGAVGPVRVSLQPTSWLGRLR
jgi:hypothetical protein